MSNFYCQRRATTVNLVILLFILKMYKNAEIHPSASSRILVESEHHLDPGSHVTHNPVQFNILFEKFLKHKLHENHQKNFENGIFHYGKSLDDSYKRLDALTSTRRTRCSELPADEKAYRLSLHYLVYISSIQNVYIDKYNRKDLSHIVTQEDLRSTFIYHVENKLCDNDNNVSLINYRSICPWKYKVFRDNDVYPPLQSHAICTCTNCTLLQNNPFISGELVYRCMPVFKYEPVLVRDESLGCDKNGQDQWVPKFIRLSVACICGLFNNGNLG